MDEWIDVLDEAGEKTGEVVLKSEAHRLGLWHGCFHCWVVGVDGSGEAYLLLQRRAENKDTWPGRLDVSVAGHLGSGEEVLDGRREIEEEIGLEAGPERLIPLGVRRVEHEIPQGLDRELHHVFLLLDSTPPDGLDLQKEEVAALIPLPLDDARAVSDGASVPATEHRDGTSEPVRVSLSELVPGYGGYLAGVVGAAKRLLAGEHAGRVF